MIATQSRMWEYPRWAPDYFLGYGYPVFNYYSPLTYVIVSVLYSIKISIYETFDTLGALSVMLGA